MPQWQTSHYSGEGEEGTAQSWAAATVGCRSPAQLLQTGRGPRPCTHKAEAAADAGLHVAAPERRHLAQLARDLDGLVEQDAQVPLVTQAPGICHLAEEICGHTDTQLTVQQQAGTGSRAWVTPGTLLTASSTELRYKEKPEL